MFIEVTMGPDPIVLKECADAARAQGDAKTVSDIARVLSLLKDAVRKHHSDCLRTIG